MKIGERIKKFRTAKGLPQKHLAIMSRMSEPAIRNYELGNRYPNTKQIEKIAEALGISPFAIADPDFDIHIALIHALFQLEDLYGLKPQDVDGKVMLTFNVEPFSGIARDLRLWRDELESLKNGAITQEEYDLWRYSFPRLQAEREQQQRREFRKHNGK